MAEDGVGSANLATAFEILSRAAQERWFSLTFKMVGGRPEELVHAMCLILLKRNSEAHAKLTANADSSIGSYLAEMVKMHGERLNGGHIASFKATDAKTLLDIARIFAILVQERFCDKSLRDQAYRAALASSRMAGLHSLDVEEEVKQVCGPDAIDKSDTELPTFKLMNDSHLFSLQSSSGYSSYSLEISSPTATEANTQESKPLSLHTPTNSESTTSREQLQQPTTNIRGNIQLPTAKGNHDSTQCRDHNGSSQIVTSKNPNVFFSPSPNDAKANDRKPPTQANSVLSSEAIQSDGEETFYAFVILHDAEDADEARRLREKLESIISADGATFSDDFAQVGKSTLGCIEDAIKNSAFALLLLTQNFKSNLSVTTADSAIINSLENHHKLNSVIPLLPRENRLSRKKFPLVLQTKVALDESTRMFERSASRAIAPDKVANQKKVWLIEQRKKKLYEERKRLQEEKVRNAELQRETEKLARLKLESDNMDNMFYAQSGQTPLNGAMHLQHASWQPQSSCIHIENAQNVMIGNNSTMNIDHVKNSADEFDF